MNWIMTLALLNPSTDVVGQHPWMSEARFRCSQDGRPWIDDLLRSLREIERLARGAEWGAAADRADRLLRRTEAEYPGWKGDLDSADDRDSLGDFVISSRDLSAATAASDLQRSLRAAGQAVSLLERIMSPG